MKKILLYTMLPFMAMVVFIAAQNTAPPLSPAQEEIELGFPDKIMTVLERSCFECHTQEGSLKPKLALNFSKWDDYKLTKKIGKLSDMAEQVKEQNMPPPKHIEEYPDMALSPEEIDMLAEWANAEADKLMEE